MREKVPNLLWEMERYSYRKLPSGVVTDEPIKLNDHACDCLRYLFMARPEVRPPAGPEEGGRVHDGVPQAEEGAGPAEGDPRGRQRGVVSSWVDFCGT